ncbi:MAG: anaerobic ribonucleoside-triphosphate reductase [Candidatus Sericytochromatia bacterium]|nr:anaerobic ribonucleoside-triphosphate reductase [Candidatus Sericytochromatia bacterium]
MMSLPEQIRKRDGRVVVFEPDKIRVVLDRAVSSVRARDLALVEGLLGQVLAYLVERAPEPPRILPVELVHACIEETLSAETLEPVARAFGLYHARRARIRETKTALLQTVEDILTGAGHEDVEAGEGTAGGKMWRIGMVASRDFYLKRLVPEEAADAHVRGDLHIHDLEHYAKTFNSCVLPLESLLREGFRTGTGSVRPPRRVASALGQVSLLFQAMQDEIFGGMLAADLDVVLARVLPDEAPGHEIEQAFEAFLHACNTAPARGSGRVPYSSMSVGLETSSLGRRCTEALLSVLAKGVGRGEPAIFPNVVFKVARGINLSPGDPNHDLLQLAAAVAGQCMMPTFAFCDAPVNASSGVDTAYLSGCARVGAGVPAGVGRVAHLATVSLNLPRLVLKARRGPLDFFQLLDQRLDLAVRSLTHRLGTLERLGKVDFPFLSRHVPVARTEGLSAMLRTGGLVVGFVGLAEALQLETGRHHGEDEEARALGLSWLRHLRERLAVRGAEEGLPLQLQGGFGPVIARRFAEADVALGGKASTYSPSFAVPSHSGLEPDAILAIEAPFHVLTDGGHLASWSTSGPLGGEAALRAVQKMASAGVGHAGFTHPIDHCLVCGKTGAWPSSCPACEAAGPMIRRVRRVAGWLA